MGSFADIHRSNRVLLCPSERTLPRVAALSKSRRFNRSPIAKLSVLFRRIVPPGWRQLCRPSLIASRLHFRNWQYCGLAVSRKQRGLARFTAGKSAWQRNINATCSILLKCWGQESGISYHAKRWNAQIPNIAKRTRCRDSRNEDRTFLRYVEVADLDRHARWSCCRLTPLAAAMLLIGFAGIWFAVYLRR